MILLDLEMRASYRVERSTVNGQLDDLDGGFVARLNGRVGRQRNLWQTDGAGIRVLMRPKNLERRDHWEGHVLRTAMRAVGAKAHVDIDEGC